MFSEFSSQSHIFCSEEEGMEGLFGDLLSHVFLFLDVPTLVLSMRTCKLWYREINSDRQWKWRFDSLTHRTRPMTRPFAIGREKDLIIEQVRWIRLFRNFIEYPSAPESRLIESTWSYGSKFNEELGNLMKGWKLTETPELVSRVFGTTSYEIVGGNYRKDWYWLVQNIMIDLGVKEEDINRIKSSDDEYLAPHLTSAEASSLRFLIWKALWKSCGQEDIGLPRLLGDYSRSSLF